LPNPNPNPIANHNSHRKTQKLTKQAIETPSHFKSSAMSNEARAEAHIDTSESIIRPNRCIVVKITVRYDQFGVMEILILQR